MVKPLALGVFRKTRTLKFILKQELSWYLDKKELDLLCAVKWCTLLQHISSTVYNSTDKRKSTEGHAESLNCSAQHCSKNINLLFSYDNRDINTDKRKIFS